jgi:hypothetical protein
MEHVHKLQGNPIKKKTPSEDVEINKMKKRVELPTKHHESKKVTKLPTNMWITSSIFNHEK